MDNVLQLPTPTPSVPIRLDRARNLRFDAKSIYRIELALSRQWEREYAFIEVLQAMAAGRLSATTLSIVLWQGCLHEDPRLTLAQVQESMPHGGDMLALDPLIRAVLDAWQAAVPPPVPDEEGRPEGTPLDGSSGPTAGPLAGSTSASVMTNFGG